MSNRIHPTVIIEGEVSLGIGNVIHPYTILIGPLIIGDNNIIGPHVTIGSPGQDTRNPRYNSLQKCIAIGSNNIIREYTAIQKPCYRDITKLGNDIYLMQSVHIPHDAIVEDNVVITPMVGIGGIVRILEGANLGIGCSINQYTVIGQYSIVAMGAPLMKNLKPFSKYIPGKQLSVNRYSIEKYGYLDQYDEISAYVLDDKWPHSDRILDIVEHYSQFHIDSKLEQY